MATTTSVLDLGAVGGANITLVDGLLESTTTGTALTNGSTTPGGPCMYCDMTRKEAAAILRTLWWYVQPTISCFGLVGNMATMVILRRQGLQKSSNILLMALAISDFLHLLGGNNITRATDRFLLLREIRWTRSEAYAIYIAGQIQGVLMEFGNIMSNFITMFITLERLIAVYLPLKFNTIVRPGRTRILLYIAAFLALIKTSVSPMEYSYIYDEILYRPLMYRSSFYYEHKTIYDKLRVCYDHVAGSVPVCAVCAGSILIGLKVSDAARKRAQMLSTSGGEKQQEGQAAPRISRTTITLLSVCLLYIATVGVGFCLETFIKDDKTWLSWIIMKKVTYVLYALNSSCNFLIYVAMNRNFREVYLEIFCPCRQANSNKSKLARTTSGLN